MRKDTDNTLMGGSSFTNTKNWRPLREINPVDTTIDQITQLQKRVLVDGAPSAQTPEMADPGTAPLAVSGVTATESPYKTTNRQLTSLVGVTFTPNVNDQNFAGVEIWFTGYNGSSSPQLMAEATTSPAQFLCETTNETVTVTVVSYNGSGLTADFTAAPTTTVLLDGVISAPPSPSISQTLVAYPLGLQFAFNQISLGGTQDIVDAYRVYRFTSNAPASATLLRTVKHDPTASGAIVVQDTVGGGATFFYWVTAVNTSGLESAKTAAQSGSVVSGTANLDSDIRDGSTYAKTIAARVTSGKPWIDFSEAIHSNKNLDNVSDGTRAAWDSVAQKTAAVDSSGNIKLKNKANADGSTSAPTTFSAVYAALPELTQTITTQGNKVLITWVCSFTVSGGGGVGVAWLAVFRDGVQISKDYKGGTSTSILGTVTGTFIDAPAAGSHTYTIQWRCAVGSTYTLTADGANRSMQVVELG